jgi:putative mRNA 3-end processing factor
MKLKFLGSAKEVGRSCIVLSTGKENLLLDCGIKLESGLEYPMFPEKKIDAIFISHAHLDHTGALPYFDKLGLRYPIFLT